MLDPSIKVIPAGYDHHSIWRGIKLIWDNPSIYNAKVLNYEHFIDELITKIYKKSLAATQDDIRYF